MSVPTIPAPSKTPLRRNPPPYKGKPASMISLPRDKTSGLRVAAQPMGSLAGNVVRRWQDRYSQRLRISDTTIVVASVLLAQYVRFGEVANTSGYSDPVMTLFSFTFATLWLTALAVFQTRSPRLIGAGIEEYRRIGSASFWTFGIIAMGTLLAKVDLARGYLAIALPVGTLGLLTSRSLWRKYISHKRAQGQCQTKVLAIGDRKAVMHLTHELTRNRQDGCVVVGVCIPGYGPPAAIS